jgi:tetratricopeptide (TPR) repeat protein
MKRFLLISIFYILPAQSQQLKLDTIPSNAEVMRKTTNGGLENLGPTPLSIDLSKLDSKNNILEFTLIKDGHANSHLILPFTARSDIKIDIKLEEVDQSQVYENFDIVNAILFEAQTLIKQTNYSKALESVNKAADIMPKLSSVHEMKATIYYLQKDIQNAYTAYEKAYTLNPKNEDAYKMKELTLKQMRSSE